jgi:peptidoglycan hydrolase-like protein with peptidoglycan-binding domain
MVAGACGDAAQRRRGGLDAAASSGRESVIHGVFTAAARRAQDDGISWPDTVHAFKEDSEMATSSVTGGLPRALGAAALAAVLAAGLAGTSAPRAAAASDVQAVAAATAATGQPWPELRQGSNGAWPQATVRSLQYLLNAHGAKLTVDGIFGPKTKAAVVAFQHVKGLNGSGVVQAATWRALLVTVQRGSAGPAVRAVQDQINFRNLKDGRTLVVDGLFGPKTQASVRAFQKAMASEVTGFRVDGVVGPQTWQALASGALSG